MMGFWVCLLVCGLFVPALLLRPIPTERALRKTFDETGVRRASSRDQ